MSKMIILENVDAVINSAGQVIAGQAANPYAADGHSSSATEMMMVAGVAATNSPRNYVDKLSFNTHSASNNFGTLSWNTCNPAAGSDGSTVMLCGGGVTSTYLDNSSKVSFQDGTEESWGTLRDPVQAVGSGASNGDELAVVGGYTGGSWYINRSDKKSFAQSTTSVDHGNLTVGGRDNNGQVGTTGDASDGTSFIIACSYGGMTGTQKKDFADGSTDETWATVDHSVWGVRPASDSTNAVFFGGSGHGYTADHIQKISFADKSACEQWGTMAQRRMTPSVSSDGNGKIMLAKGYHSNPEQYWSSLEYKAFDSNSTTEVSSSLTNLAAHGGEGSGN